MGNLLRAIINSSLVVMALVQPALACTDFQVKTDQGAVVTGRSMEWSLDLKSRLVVHPREESGHSSTPNGKDALQWKSKYGYVGVDANGLDVSVDGLNEKGLSFGLLWLPGYTKYQDVAPDQSKNALSVTELGAWILGNFSTVDEVQKAMPTVRVWAPEIPSFGGIPTAHMAVHDATGRNLVLEFVDGQQKIYDNPIGVMTNAPTFDWQLTNLKNYLMVRADGVEPVNLGGSILAPFGQGSGFFGIPGDWSPPSRFVRTTAMVVFAEKTHTPMDGVILADHILNAVDIPRGTVREQAHNYVDYTQWALIKDLSNHRLYYRSYEDPSLRLLDLNKLDLAPGTQRRMVPVATVPHPEEVAPIQKSD